MCRTSTTDKESHSSHSTTDTSHESVTTYHPSPSPCVSTVNPPLDAEPCPTRALESVPDSHSAIASGDFGKVVKLKATRAYNLTDMDKYKLLTEHYIPAPSYPFPACTIGSTVRHFQHSWLMKYPGLVYSLTEEGEYCVLFLNPGPSGKELRRPLHNFKKASEFLNDPFHKKLIRKHVHICN